MSWSIFEIVGYFAAILVLLYYYAASKLEFWEKRGVKGPKPILFFGNFKDVLLGRCSTTQVFEKAYYEFKSEQMIGVFGGHEPFLILKDPDLIKDVLIKDFSKFVNRNLQPVREVDPLSEHLFRLDAEKWKPLRSRLSPVFTSGKLKEMFHLLLECSDHFEKYVDRLVAKGEPIECREISAKFTTDVIGSCAFGIEINALSDEDSEFRAMGRRVFQPNWKSIIRDRLIEYPILFRIFGRFVIDHELIHFFQRITKEQIDYRIENNFCRYDFIDTLVDLKKHPEKLGLKEVDDVYLTAQAFVFFAAGFETSSITITNTLYELALNQSIQDKVRAEIKDVLEETDGKITYDCIRKMKYLDACFQETLRKYPVVLWLARKSTASYTFSGTKVSIPKGQQVFLPVYTIQNDPDIFPNPTVYDPERFNEENIKTRHPMYFLPFGDGPRNCIGARFAKNQSKVALIKILSKFKVEECEKTCKKYEINHKTLFILQPTHGIYVKMTKLEE
ncbi:Cytochrome P450 6B1 [Habropoda laboriosa]|uniref:Cytochrome P450 6B1 n=1 Tax=Habropoda laboriosa TaxID=597456 RepID=A0A0L7QTY4_9HYME|nr:PREDICTED: cytochrome P450 6B1-like [Habropoda laboriosa]KOC62019.1 Cytochrome P450 6B1 [Habropoda laboriosa]